MICYIDRTEVPDVENIAPNVLQYLITNAERANQRYSKLVNTTAGTMIFLTASQSQMRRGWR